MEHTAQLDHQIDADRAPLQGIVAMPERRAVAQHLAGRGVRMAGVFDRRAEERILRRDDVLDFGAQPGLLQGNRVLIAFFVTIAALSFVFRAWPRVVGLTGAGLAALAGLWLWSLDFDRPFWLFPNGVTVDLTAPITRFGYTFRLQEANAPIVAMNLAIAAAALLLAARTTADRNFSAVTWLLVTGYSLLALIVAGPIAPALASPILLVMLTALGIFALQGNRSANPTGPVRMLIPPILAARLLRCDLVRGPTAAQSPGRDVAADHRWAAGFRACLLYTSPSPRDRTRSRMPSSA